MAMSLSSVRRHVEQMATRAEQMAQAACPECRGQDLVSRLVWGEVPPSAPASEPCSQCGRECAVSYTVVGWSDK